MSDKTYRVLVLNGSPKGDNSITLQYVNYLAAAYPNARFETVHAARNIVSYKRHPETLRKLLEHVLRADIVLFSFGVWVLGVSCQLMSFIELIGNTGASLCFKGKPVGLLSTSIHYFDHLAHRYLRAVCEDFEMRFIAGLSMDIMDLHDSGHCRTLRQFGQTLFDGIETRYEAPRESMPLPNVSFVYQSDSPQKRVSIDDDTHVLILTDGSDGDSNEKAMVERLRNGFSGGRVDVVHLKEIPMKGGCRGCMRCGYDYTCTYKDGFDEFYNDKVRNADILVFCGTVKGRYLSSRWKRFFDRAFFWNHTPSLVGKQIAYLISGPVRHNPHLAEALEAHVTARQLANFVGIVTDEDEDATRLDTLIDNLAFRLAEFSRAAYIEPANFLAVGGLKIFRDDIWGRLRAVWQADYRYYKRNGLFDFPHRQWGMRLLGWVATGLCIIPALRKRFYGMMQQPPPLLVRRVSALKKNKSILSN